MIRPLSVHRALILDCSKDDGKSPLGTASNEMLMGAMQALCEFSLLVSQQKHTDLPLRALDDIQRQF
jgi:hypothetical protein